MRRSVLLTAFVVVVALGVATAQRHGRGRFVGPVPGFHKGFGPGVSFGFGHAPAVGFVPGGMGFANGAGIPPTSSFIPRVSIRVGPGGKFFGHRGFRRGFIHPGFLGGSVVVPYPVYFGDPFYGYYSQEQAAAVAAAAAAEAGEQQRLDVELQGVKNELRALREERETARVAPSGPPKTTFADAGAAPAPAATPLAPEAPPTMFVMRDGRKIETRNYAIVGQTLWVFNDRRATKFAIAEVDVGSTTQANAERGVDVNLPRK